MGTAGWIEFFSEVDGYVIRNDNTGDIVEMSNRNDPLWKAPR
jgi:hypothetical protein